jgi:hypothetical protein
MRNTKESERVKYERRAKMRKTKEGERTNYESKAHS